MTAVAESHILQDQAQVATITKRLKRAHGQMGAVVRMLEEGRSCEEVVMQMAAVGKPSIPRPSHSFRRASRSALLTPPSTAIRSPRSCRSSS